MSAHYKAQSFFYQSKSIHTPYQDKREINTARTAFKVFEGSAIAASA